SNLSIFSNYPILSRLQDEVEKNLINNFLLHRDVKNGKCNVCEVVLLFNSRKSMLDMSTLYQNRMLTLRQAFPLLRRWQSLWTRSSFVSTISNVSSRNHQALYRGTKGRMASHVSSLFNRFLAQATGKPG